MKIALDDRNLSAQMVGEEHGLSPAEIQLELPRAQNALEQFRRAVDEGLYGFPQLPFDTALADSIQAYAQEKAGSYEAICLLGIGGSALGAWALDCALRGPHPVQRRPLPRLVVLDNVDPEFVSAALDSLSPARTLVAVIAKSGATAETMASYLVVRDWLDRSLGPAGRDRVVVVTSPHRGDLKTLALREQLTTFHLPENVGGRFSVLSAVGLLPAALIGVRIHDLLDGARRMTERCWSPDLEQNLALRAALLHYLLYTRRSKAIHVAFPYSNLLWGLAFWFRQLWAESLGKERTRKGELIHAGQTPVAALGATDQHSQVQLYMEGPNDKVFSFWTIEQFAHDVPIPSKTVGLESFDYLAGKTLGQLLQAEQRATAAALTSRQRPNCTVRLHTVDELHIGAFLQMMEFQTAFMGELLDINAFDQEGVELGKKLTFALMGRPGYENYAEQLARIEGRQTFAHQSSPMR